MLNYLLEVSFCWLGFYLLYQFLLQKETFHHANRWYLLGTLILGIVIPLLEFPVAVTPEEGITEYYLQTITVGLESFESAVVTVATETNLTSEISTLEVLLFIYWVGVALGFSRLGYGLFQIFQLYQSAEIIQKDGYKLVETSKPHLPFSFLGFLFLNKEVSLENPEFSNTDRQKIIKHEEAHIRQGHSLDVLFLEVLSIFLWCSPLIYFYKKSLRIVHEYLADDSVLRISKKKQYGRLLLKQSQSGMQLALANNFFHSQLKKRLEMMTKTKSKRKALLKYAFVIPILALSIFLFAKEDVLNNFHLSDAFTECNMDKSDAENKIARTIEAFEFGKEGWQKKANENLNVVYQQLKKANPNCEKEIDEMLKMTAFMRGYSLNFNEEDVQIKFKKLPSKDAPKGLLDGDPEIFKVVEEMPRFPGCEEVEDGFDREKCAQTKMLEFIYNNLQYPKEAAKNDIEGMVVVKFVVGKDGSILKPEIIRAIGGGCDEEVLRVVGEMPKWIPGKQRGKNVNVQFNLPIRFKLDGEKKEEPKEEKELSPEEVDQMPLFNGTDTNGTPGEIKTSSNTEMINHIIKYVKYPKTAAKEEVEGMVVAKFTVGVDGSVSSPEIKKSLHVDCDAQVIRTIEAMPNWIPAQKDGKPVAVSMMLPVKFKLDDATKENAAESELPDAVQNLKVDQFKVFPNPSEGKVSLEFKAEAAPTSILIVDSFGREVFRKELLDYDGGIQNLVDIDLSQANKGTLFVVVSQNDGAKKYAERIILK
jgi:TonB family protein